MTAPWWAGLDEAGLAALGSAGLLRRARAARIGAVAAPDARVEVEGFTVTLGGKGPAAARCPCPATGVCLHILAAILALQAAAPAPAGDVLAELCALAEADLLAFAGSDLAPALRLAAEAVPGPAPPAASLTLALPGLADPVTFLAGAGLRGALWKGPDSRRRLAVAAAALALRASCGLPLPEAPGTEAARGLDRDLLLAIGTGVEAAVAPTLQGLGALAADGLLDLALSARIEAAPRLAGALRALVALAVALGDRGAAADAGAFLVRAARAQALAHALAAPDADPALLGILRRDYRAAPPLTLQLLGARVWRAPTGARGLRLWAWDAAGGRWIVTGAARPDGLDPGFDPVEAYRRPILGQPSAAGAMGQSLDLAAPLLSDDLRLQADCAARARPLPLPPPEAEGDWTALAHRLRAGLGPALLRDGRIVAALIAPAAWDPPAPGPAGWHLPLRDTAGRGLSVALPGVSQPAREALARLPRGACLLVEAREDLGRLTLDLVSVLPGAGGPAVWTPALDPAPDWPKPGWLARVLPRPGPSGTPPGPRPDPLARDLLEAAIDLGQGQPPPAEIAARIRASGVAAVDRLLSPPASPAKALRLAWIAAELDWRRDLG